MSGIAGIVNFERPVGEPHLIRSMTATMAHRGPNGIRHWSNGSVALGHCMLHTTPESLEELQPLLNEDETLALVMDGRADNWKELRSELLTKGVRLRTRSDAELILRAYETWGPNCVTHVDGDFAFAVWNARRRELFCARDRIGSKPFLYHWEGGRLVFATEPSAILKLPWVDRQLSEGMIAEFLATDWYTRDETFWRGIYRLIPGHRMRVDRGGLHIDEYWTPNLQRELRYKRQEEYAEHYKALLFDVVRKQSRSHKPVACEVSGGLDSSAIFAVGEHLRRDGKLLAPGIEGYTLLFDDGSEADELEYARAVGRYLGREVHEINPTRQPLRWHTEWARRYEAFPPYPNGSFALSIREAARRAGSTVLLTGIGGDEWLSGSRIYYAETMMSGDWRGLFDSATVDAKAFGWTTVLWWIFRQGLYPLLPERARIQVRNILRRGPITQGNLHQRLTPRLRAALKTQKQKPTQLPPISRRVGQRGQLAPLFSAYAKFTKEAEELLAATTGIELRSPFYSTPMIDFSLATATRTRIRGDINRVLHREAMVGLLPELVRNRVTKADFMITYAWYLPELRQTLLSNEHLSSLHWVTPSGTAKLFRQAGRPKYGGWPEWALWSLFGCLSLMTGDNLSRPEKGGFDGKPTQERLRS